MTPGAGGTPSWDPQTAHPAPGWIPGIRNSQDPHPGVQGKPGGDTQRPGPVTRWGLGTARTRRCWNSFPTSKKSWNSVIPQLPPGAAPASPEPRREGMERERAGSDPQGAAGAASRALPAPSRDPGGGQGSRIDEIPEETSNPGNISRAGTRRGFLGSGEGGIPGSRTAPISLWESSLEPRPGGAGSPGVGRGRGGFVSPRSPALSLPRSRGRV